MPRLIKETAAAWIDKMPGAGGPLIATVDVEVPSGGWTGSLKRTQPQGFNPNVLLLDVVLVKPSGEAASVMSTLKLRFEERPAAHPYTQVQFTLDGVSVTADVRGPQ
ncbi:hypothetical protein ACC668_17675 [Rhizobium ruizarguesonis]